MATCWPQLTVIQRGVLEGRMMSLWPELDHAGWCIRQFKAPEEENGWPIEQMKDWARYALRDSGMRQWSTFRQLADVDLSPPARRRSQELDRKFVGRRPEEPDGIRSSVSRSPVCDRFDAARPDDAVGSGLGGCVVARSR